mmetsp:Transcript_6974/g.17505  ORF Transcript_6974/g.17505 Transcript_6974/m.17505 type:complete len:152 (+) Transcript_6974:80-535(+)
MGGGKGKSRGATTRSAASKLPTLSSREDLDRAIRNARANARANHHNANQGSGSSGSLVVLKFTATWCGVCRKIAPFYEGLARDPKVTETSNVVALYNVDVDEAHDLTNSYGASALPLFVFLVDGKKVDTLVGAQQTALKKKILKHVSSCKR